MEIKSLNHNASTNKLKVAYADIIVVGRIDKPYFMIRYKEIGKDEICEGYGSFNLDFVFMWKEQFFEIVEERVEQEINMDEITYGELYKEFCEWSPKRANMVKDYRPWGSHSIIVWLTDGHAYKVKRLAPGKLIMQLLSKEDIDKKFGLN